MKISELSASEKRLMAVVAVLVVVLVNFTAIKFFLATKTQLQDALVQKTQLCDTLRILAGNTSLWEERGQWLQKNQPKLENEAVEGNALLNFLKDSASKHGVTLSKQQLVAAKSDTGYVAVPVEVELKANWRNLCGFLAEIQSPERFVVIQQSRLKVDPSDATQMLCNITVAKWFAPR